MKCMVAHACGQPVSGPRASRLVEAEGTWPGGADGPRRWFRWTRRNVLGEASSAWIAWIMLRCGQIWVWGARLGDKRLSALRAKSAELLAACPEPKFGVGIAAIHVVVVRRIMAMTPFGRRLPKFGSGLMFSVHQAVLLHDHALLRDTRAPDRIGGAVRVGGSSRSLARSQARFGVRNPDHVVPADPALDRVSWPARRMQRRPVACLAPRGMTCCNARLS